MRVPARVRLAVAVLAVAWAGAACGSGGKGPVTEHHFDGGAPQAVGADCSAAGPTGCLSGLCLHASAQLGQGYVCSQKCGVGVGVCPTKWSCVQIHPSAEASVCVPPPSASSTTLARAPGLPGGIP